jgi:hypothetical protein
MDVGNKTVSIMERIDTDMERLTEGEAALEIVDTLDVDHNGAKAATVVLTFKDGSRFGMYSTGSTASLQAYLRGFRQVLDLITGEYTLLPINDEAKKRRKKSILPWKEQAEQFRLGQIVRAVQDNKSAAKSPRFAFHRSKYKPVE